MKIQSFFFYCSWVNWNRIYTVNFGDLIASKIISLHPCFMSTIRLANMLFSCTTGDAHLFIHSSADQQKPIRKQAINWIKHAVRAEWAESTMYPKLVSYANGYSLPAINTTKLSSNICIENRQIRWNYTGFIANFFSSIVSVLLFIEFFPCRVHKIK